MAFEVMALISCRQVKVWNEMVKPIQKEHEGSGRNLKWVMMALADYSNKEGYCYPSVRSIEQFTGLSTRSVQRALKQADRIGLIRIRRRMDSSSEYLIDLERLPFISTKRNPKQPGPHQQFFEDVDMFDIPPIDVTDVDEDVAGTGVTVAPDPCQTGTTPVSGSHPPPATVAPKPISEPVIEPVSEPVSAETARANGWGLGRFIEVNWQQLKQEHPHIAGIRKLTDTMLDNARTRAKQHMNEGEDAIDVWAAVFDNIRNSPFLLGKIAPGQGRTNRFKLAMSKILKPHIFERTINGEYLASATDRFDPDTGEVVGPAATAASSTVDRIRQAGQRS